MYKYLYVNIETYILLDCGQILQRQESKKLVFWSIHDIYTH